LLQHHADRLRRQRRPAAAAARVVQSGNTPGQEALTPIVHRHPRHTKPRRDLPLLHTIGTQQDDLSPLSVPHGDRHCPQTADQFLPLGSFQYDLAADHQSLASRVERAGEDCEPIAKNC